MAARQRRFGRRAEPAPYAKPRAISASAARIRLQDRTETDAIRERSAGQFAWQTRAWEHYDSIGEVSFAFNLVASVLSRVRIHAAVITDPDSPPVELTDAVKIEREDQEDNPQTNKGVDPRMLTAARDYMADLDKGQGLPTMLRAYALNISVPGECYLACIEDEWSIRSTTELTVQSDGSPVLRTSVSSSTMQAKVLSKETPIGRIWRQHPRFSDDPDSSMKSLQDDCEELLLLGRMIRNTTRSRLNAGILFVPDTISAAAETLDDDSEENDEDEDIFEKELLQAMTAPISDESSAAAVVPMLVRGPETAGGAIKLIQLSRDVDQHLIARADRILERILQGLDVPKDLVTGLANVKYSNAIQIDESLYKAHVEPLALMFVDAITEIYLQPLLKAKAESEGWDKDDASRVVVWYDPSEVVTHPNRNDDATVGLDRHALSEAAWRRANGFTDADAPDEDEIGRRLAYSAAPMPPDIIVALLKHLVPDILEQARQANMQGQGKELPGSLTDMLQGGQGAAPAEPGSSLPDTEPGDENATAPTQPPALSVVP